MICFKVGLEWLDTGQNQKVCVFAPRSSILPQNYSLFKHGYESLETVYRSASFYAIKAVTDLMKISLLYNWNSPL